MRVMTFNIQHALDYQKQIVDTSLFADAIRRYSVDVCGLNEVRRGDGSHPDFTDQAKDIGDALGYTPYFGKAIRFDGECPHDYGNAIVSRYPIRSVETVPIPDPVDRSEPVYYETRCVIKAILDVEGTDVCFLVCHMGLAESERYEAVKTLCNVLDTISMPVILMGDFNDVPTAAILRPLYDRLQDTATQGDAASMHTFSSYEPHQKIDYILYRGLTCTNASVIPEIVSDHFPIMADFDGQ